jgi:transcriptional regulator GlxA family with amidase domain
MLGGNDNNSSKTANAIPSRRVRATRSVVLFAFERAQLLDIAGPLQVFATASELAADEAVPPYRLRLVSMAGGPITTSSSIAVVTQRATFAAAKAIDTLIVAGGPGVSAAAADARSVAWVKAAAKAARRRCSVCTGAFLLAAAGLLKGRRAVTHWRACAALARRYPDIQVEADPIFVEDGAVWTSAGVTAGIDLALALVERDLGRRTALQVAQRLVVFLKRPGGQSQFSAALAAQASDDGAFGDLHDWMAANLAADLRVERLAERACMSVRNFARLYHARTGTTPAKAVVAMRVEAARSMLEQTPMAIAEIAKRCGFGDEEGLRRAFQRSLGVAPGRYRSRFAPASLPKRETSAISLRS